jgi:hypothetical protein
VAVTSFQACRKIELDKQGPIQHTDPRDQRDCRRPTYLQRPPGEGRGRRRDASGGALPRPLTDDDAVGRDGTAEAGRGGRGWDSGVSSRAEVWHILKRGEKGRGSGVCFTPPRHTDRHGRSTHPMKGLKGVARTVEVLTTGPAVEEARGRDGRSRHVSEGGAAPAGESGRRRPHDSERRFCASGRTFA